MFSFQPVYAATDDMIHVLNPDPYSQAMGASILALSPSVFGFFVNPASNYQNFSKEIQLSYMSFFDSNYGASAGIVKAMVFKPTPFTYQCITKGKHMHPKQ